MLFVTLLFFVLAAVNGQRLTPDYLNNPYKAEGPRLYSFNYRSVLKDGVGESSRSESTDGTGQVQGSYSLNNAEGHYRFVEYVADEDGFRAVIRTNEPGTSNKNPANVIMQYEPGTNEYNPVVRRPVAVDVVSPVFKPAAVPKPVIAPEPVRRPFRHPAYRRPPVYSGRNPRFRLESEAGINRNVPVNRVSELNPADDLVSPNLETADLAPISPSL